MSFHLPHHSNRAEDTDSDSSQADDDQNWDDWVSDSFAKHPSKSLFDENTFPSVEAVLLHDKSTHGFDLDGTCLRLCLSLFLLVHFLTIDNDVDI